MTEAAAQVKAPPKQAQKEIADAERMHKELYPSKDITLDDNSQDEIDELVSSLEESEPSKVTPVAEVAEVAEIVSTPDSKPREDWKQKYYTLQGKYDAEVPRLSSELRDLKGQISEISSRQAEPVEEVSPQTVGHSLITEEEVELYGEDFIDVVGRRAQEIAQARESGTIAELRNEIANIKGTVNDTGKRIERTEQESFYVKLDRQLEDWREINVEPEFVGWLDTVIPETRGLTRKSVLMDAFNSGNVEDTANVFRTYKSAKQGNAQPSASNMVGQPAGKATLDLNQYVAPSAGQGSPQGNTGEKTSQKIWTQQEIASFYADVRQGKFRKRPEDKSKIEQAIVNASAQGRVR